MPALTVTALVGVVEMLAVPGAAGTGTARVLLLAAAAVAMALLAAVDLDSRPSYPGARG